MKYEIIQGDCLNELPKIKEKSVNLLLVDPPYYKTRGEFDFIWEAFDDYLEDVEKWAIACKRLLTDNGSLLWFGSAKNIAYTQVILDKYFSLINNLVWDKGSFMGLEKSKGLRSFAPCTERVLFYGNDFDVNSLDEIMFNDSHFSKIKNYLKSEKEKVKRHFGFSSKEFNNYTLKLGCSTTPYKNWFCNTGYWEMATETMYKKLQVSGFFQKPYPELRQEYEELRRPFDNFKNLQEVLRFSNEKSHKYKHPTKKPVGLIQALIETTTRKGDLVVDPFMGSGTTGKCCVITDRDFIGVEIDSEHYKEAFDRIKKAKQKKDRILTFDF